MYRFQKNLKHPNCFLKCFETFYNILKTYKKHSKSHPTCSNPPRNTQAVGSKPSFSSHLPTARTMERRVVMGSRPTQQGIWAAWKRCGYEVGGQIDPPVCVFPLGFGLGVWLERGLETTLRLGVWIISGFELLKKP